MTDSENIYQAIFEKSIDAILIITPDGDIQSANRAACKLFARTETEIREIGRNGLLDPSDQRIAVLLSERNKTGKTSGEVNFRRRDGSVFPADITSTIFIDSDGRERGITVIRDITLRTEAEELLSASNELLKRINRATSKYELIKSVTEFLRLKYGFEAVGVRLKEGEDYPYFQSSGFSNDFILLEKNLCSYDIDRKVIKDSEGNPILDCMCGNVISSRFDPSQPFFTPHGSFWSNCTTELLATTTEADRKARTRNRCNGEGYESVGLFPLKSGDKTFGLLQVNDKRTGMFTPVRIKVLEILGDNLAIALAKFKMEEELLSSEEKYRLLAEQSDVGVGFYSPEGMILYFNTQALKNMGGKAEDYIGKSLIEVFGKKEGTRFINRIREEIRLNKSLVFEDYFESPTGKYWFSSSHSVVCNSKGEVIGVQVVSHDISERKLFEEKLNQATLELRELTRHLLDVREEERTLIARDLHDDLGQKLTALNMDISWLKSRIGVQSRTVENKFHQMSLLISGTIESIQKLSYGLRPSILDDLGLIPAIEWQTRDFGKASGIKTKFFQSPQNLSFNGKISLVVFRIVQETLTNVARHSGATRVVVRLNFEDNLLEVSIKDNGKGIDQKEIESSKSFGLIGMRERVSAIGGELKITSSKGEGTIVALSVPVDA
jgi:PAS domain S-box-containing protein